MARMKWALILTLVILPTMHVRSLSSSCSGPAFMSNGTGCLCPSDSLQLMCSVIGGINTVWTGSAITGQCNGTDSIFLRHSGFSGNITRSCPNSGAVIGQSLPSLSNITADCYTSQLIISVTTALNETAIICQVDNNMQPFPEVGQYNISITSEPYSPPDNIQLIGITSEGLTFNWTSVDPTCSALSYKVSAVDCGKCPSSTNSTTVVCSGIELSGDTQTCTLSVQSVVCGDIISNFSDRLSISLQATNLPRASILPRYWQNTTDLAGLEVEIPIIDPIVISGISVAVKSYRVNYFNSITGDVCGPAAELSLANETTTCTSNEVCKVRRNLILPESCGNNDVDVTISATSVLGTGPPTQPFTIDGTNRFVNITFDSVINKFYCIFLNQQDTSGKSCNVSYAPCGDQLMQTTVGYSNTERPNLVEIQLNLPEFESRSTYCYVVAASNDTFKILIEGSIVKRRGKEARDGLKSGSIAGIVLGVIFFPIPCIILILIAVILVWRRSKNVDIKQTSTEDLEMTPQRDAKKYESDNSALQTESVDLHATEKTNERDDSIPSHDPNDRATDVEDKPDSDHNQRLASIHATKKTDERDESIPSHDPSGRATDAEHKPDSDHNQKLAIQIESIHATEKTDEKDDSVPGHDPNGRATDAEVKPNSDHNQKPATLNSNVSEAVSSTMGVDETTDGSENKKAMEHDQSSDQAQVTTESSVDPDKGCTEETMSKDNNNEQASDFVIVMPAQDQPPEWTPDKDAPDCMRCEARFTVINRRHHCRYCGHVFCDSCSKRKAVLPWKPSKEQRVCNQCYETLSTANKEKN